MTDAEWLAARPEIAAKWESAWLFILGDGDAPYRDPDVQWRLQVDGALAAVLPMIRREIIAELAEEAKEPAFIRTLMEEFVNAGFPAGDRTVVLANVRRLIAERAAAIRGDSAQEEAEGDVR